MILESLLSQRGPQTNTPPSPYRGWEEAVLFIEDGEAGHVTHRLSPPEAPGPWDGQTHVRHPGPTSEQVTAPPPAWKGGMCLCLGEANSSFTDGGEGGHCG